MEELKHLRNDVGSQLASMECVPRHNTVDCPTLFWAAIPGNEGDFPSEESFHTFIEQSVCLFTEETNYMDSPSPFGIKMADRTSGKPLHIDISDLPMRKGVTTNRNKFVLGPSGSGKSFFMIYSNPTMFQQTHNNKAIRYSCAKQVQSLPPTRKQIVCFVQQPGNVSD